MCWNKILELFYPNPNEKPQSNHEFYIWAFGEKYPILNHPERISAWNMRHGFLITFTDLDTAQYYLPIMKNHYSQYLLVNDFSTKIIEGQ